MIKMEPIDFETELEEQITLLEKRNDILINIIYGNYIKCEYLMDAGLKFVQDENGLSTPLSSLRDSYIEIAEVKDIFGDTILGNIESVISNTSIQGYSSNENILDRSRINKE